MPEEKEAPIMEFAPTPPSQQSAQGPALKPGEPPYVTKGPPYPPKAEPLKAIEAALKPPPPPKVSPPTPKK